VQFASRLLCASWRPGRAVVDYFTRFRQTSACAQDYISHVRSQARGTAARSGRQGHEVALRVGYPDEVFFSRMFKMQVCITRKRYRICPTNPDTPFDLTIRADVLVLR
jgi:hypothetical protein